MVRRDPHEVLGIARGADPAAFKAAWRRLARTHHPDLTGDDPAASRVATRKMAEINEAYAALTRLGDARGDTRRGGTDRAPEDDAAGGEAGQGRRASPPQPKPTRPVTRRVDMSDTFRVRNQKTTDGRANPLAGQPPRRGERVAHEPLRSSDPNGPLERGRVRGFRRAPGPSLALAIGLELEFGKFHGHTLGEVAAFEPSYIDWLARTVRRDPDLVAAARVVQADLDRRGITRGHHEASSAARGV